MSTPDENSEEPIAWPVSDELDLHTFRPSDLGILIPAYLEAAHGKGLRQVRIIHGKGTGTLRTTVHTLLDRNPHLVARYRLGDETSGSWGATLVTLHETPTSDTPAPLRVPVGDESPPDPDCRHEEWDRVTISDTPGHGWGDLWVYNSVCRKCGKVLCQNTDNDHGVKREIYDQDWADRYGIEEWSNE